MATASSAITPLQESCAVQQPQRHVCGVPALMVERWAVDVGACAYEVLDSKRRAQLSGFQQVDQHAQELQHAPSACCDAQLDSAG